MPLVTHMIVLRDYFDDAQNLKAIFKKFQVWSEPICHYFAGFRIVVVSIVVSF
jgi:hypothetical protein